jgi:hypothetical protein
MDPRSVCANVGAGSNSVNDDHGQHDPALHRHGLAPLATRADVEE